MAREAPPSDVVGAIAEEIGRLHDEELRILRYDGDAAVVLGASGGDVSLFPIGLRIPLGGDNVSTRVFETGKPVRIADYGRASGAIGEAARRAGARSVVGTPIIVHGRTWGVSVVGSIGETGQSEAKGIWAPASFNVRQA